MKIKLPAGSARDWLTQDIYMGDSILSRAQPVTGIAPTTPVVLSIGVSEAAIGSKGVTVATFTVMICGAPIAPGESDCNCTAGAGSGGNLEGAGANSRCRRGGDVGMIGSGGPRYVDAAGDGHQDGCGL